jgi:hypothetical protein
MIRKDPMVAGLWDLKAGSLQLKWYMPVLVLSASFIREKTRQKITKYTKDDKLVKRSFKVSDG